MAADLELTKNKFSDRVEELFYEQQNFYQWWIWVILIISNLILITLVSLQVFMNVNIVDFPNDNTILLAGTALIFSISILFWRLQLETKIKSDGIYVRFFPIQLTYKFYPWSKLTKCYVRKYYPIAEFGGWGLRWSFFGKGAAYCVSGNKGIQLIFMGGKKLLIGTNQPIEVIRVLKRINKYVK